MASRIGEIDHYVTIGGLLGQARLEEMILADGSFGCSRRDVLVFIMEEGLADLWLRAKHEAQHQVAGMAGDRAVRRRQHSLFRQYTRDEKEIPYDLDLRPFVESS